LKIIRALDALNEDLARRLRDKYENVILDIRIWWWIITHKKEEQ